MRKILWPGLTCLIALALVAGVNTGAQAQVLPLPGSSIPQWVNNLPTLTGAGGANSPLMASKLFPAGASVTNLYMRPFKVNMLPPGTPIVGLPYSGTRVFGYLLTNAALNANPDTYIGPVFVTKRSTFTGNPATTVDNSTGIRYVNNLGLTTDTATPPFWPASLDQTLHWGNPNKLPMYITTGTTSPYPVGPNPDRMAYYSAPIAAAAHLHGGEQPASIDGGPDSWFLSQAFGGFQMHGPGYYTSPIDAAAANEAVYRYPNVMEAAPTWFHDHLLGGTRLNVYAGLAGAYLLTDFGLVLPTGMNAVGLNNGTLDLSGAPYNVPNGANTELTVPLVIQDRSFFNNGELLFPNLGLNPTVHPFWIPEFVGDTIVVNGKAWPNLNVEAKRYRFLLLNGSNARTYELSLGNNVPMYVIGTDGGYLDSAVKVSKLVIMPGERYQLIIDFGKYAGKTIIMTNTGRTPFPKGAPPQGSTLGRIVQFTVGPVTSFAGADPSYDPATTPGIRTGNQKIQRLPGTPLGPAIVPAPAAGFNVTQFRQLTLNEVIGPLGPLEILVNNTKWNGLYQFSATSNTADPMDAFRPISFDTGTNQTQAKSDGIGNWLTELPAESTTEVWEIINLTADAHPIHVHLVQFQLMNRQNFNVNNYTKAYNAAFLGGFDPSTGLTVGAGVYIPSFGPPLLYNTNQTPTANPPRTTIGGNPDVTPFLQGAAAPPGPNEAGWKDTVVMYPGQVTRIVVRQAPQDVAPSVTNATFAFTPNPPNSAAVDGDLPNYDFVFHCHIIDHEDNEMMRPYQVIPAVAEGARTYKMGVNY